MCSAKSTTVVVIIVYPVMHIKKRKLQLTNYVNICQIAKVKTENSMSNILVSCNRGDLQSLLGKA